MNELNDISTAITAHAAATTAALAEQDIAIRALRERQGDLEQKTLEVGGGIPANADGVSALSRDLLKNEQVQGVAQKASTRTSLSIKTAQLLGLQTKGTVVGTSFMNEAAGGVYTGLGML